MKRSDLTETPATSEEAADLALSWAEDHRAAVAVELNHRRQLPGHRSLERHIHLLCAIDRMRYLRNCLWHAGAMLGQSTSSTTSTRCRSRK